MSLASMVHKLIAEHIAAVGFSDRLVQYEWVEADKKWAKFHDDDPDPPEDLPTGMFDGQIIDVDSADPS